MHNTPWFSDIFSFVWVTEVWSSFTYLSFIHWWVAKGFFFVVFFLISHLQGNNVIIKLTVTEYIFKPSENLESLWKTWNWWGLWEVFLSLNFVIIFEQIIYISWDWQRWDFPPVLIHTWRFSNWWTFLDKPDDSKWKESVSRIQELGFGFCWFWFCFLFI